MRDPHGKGGTGIAYLLRRGAHHFRQHMLGTLVLRMADGVMDEMLILMHYGAVDGARVLDVARGGEYGGIGVDIYHRHVVVGIVLRGEEAQPTLVRYVIEHQMHLAVAPRIVPVIAEGRPHEIELRIELRGEGGSIAAVDIVQRVEHLRCLVRRGPDVAVSAHGKAGEIDC